MLVDTAVWIDHLRYGNPALVELLEQMQVTVHPFVIGEIACGYLSDRAEVLESLHALPMLPVADHSTVMEFVGRQQLMGRGLGWIDVHLLASASAADETLMTPDRRLRAAAVELGLAT